MEQMNESALTFHHKVKDVLDAHCEKPFDFVDPDDYAHNDLTIFVSNYSFLFTFATIITRFTGSTQNDVITMQRLEEVYTQIITILEKHMCKNINECLKELAEFCSKEIFARNEV